MTASTIILRRHKHQPRIRLPGLQATWVSNYQADLESQRAITQYDKPTGAFEVTKPGYCDLYYIHNDHFMVRGQLSDIILIWRDGETSWLRWRGLPYPTASIDPITHRLLPPREESFPIMEAPKANLDMNSVFGCEPRSRDETLSLV